MSADEDNHAGLAVILVFLLLFWLARAIFTGADQTK